MHKRYTNFSVSSAKHEQVFYLVDHVERAGKNCVENLGDVARDVILKDQSALSLLANERHHVNIPHKNPTSSLLTIVAMVERTSGSRASGTLRW